MNKFLIITGPLFPQPGNNANLIGKLIPYLAAKNEVHLVTRAETDNVNLLPKKIFGCPVHWVIDKKRGIKRQIFMPVKARKLDPNGYSDAITAMIVKDELKRIRKAYAFNVIVSTSEPFYGVYSASEIPDVFKILYLMDPPEVIRGDKGTAFRNRELGNILNRQDMVLTTPFIHQALDEKGYHVFIDKIHDVGFPMIDEHDIVSIPTLKWMPKDKINLLFCGWLYSDIRSPQYFLKIVESLDERFHVIFMGKECEKLRERFKISTKASITTMGQQTYDVALAAMNQADILINIGNSVPVHMPSKTLEYINTGKPFVNFYKFEDCPTLHYTERYPLCMNMNEQNLDIEAASSLFVKFCVQRKSEYIKHDWVEQEYEDCTPQYIVKQIIEMIGE